MVQRNKHELFQRPRTSCDVFLCSICALRLIKSFDPARFISKFPQLGDVMNNSYQIKKVSVLAFCPAWFEIKKRGES